ncbi:DNA translocase FtsK [Leptospira gomenensis]|uniref:DNA translocase FtsK n=1 Tax=Leptospira gomenensis TaxID=2484974 RepID=A0A5F1Z0P9_9LEPT|nr:DNA translocase FtsK [Leptospira gomenensis]TGK31055.1 DNA translocase FtsK [Leptospira gomenensis]TGK43260.1 DNA translocase FtsK [Leptospira gomenensis]TGK45225.1 DNA translocase FtsK [Leptospira gomenensis]TGK66140.1 DNA translocase FtsK [Leptospira gomenensis]
MESKEQKTAWNLQNGKKILPYVLLFSGIFLTLSLGSFDAGEEGIRHNFFGRLGFYLSYGMFFLFGAASFLPGLFAIGLGSLRLVKDEFELTNRLFSLPVFLFCFTVTLQITGHVSTIPFASQGGFTGQLLSAGLEFIFGATGKILIHLVFYFYGLILLLNESPLHFLGRMVGVAGAKYKEGLQSGVSKSGEGLGALFQSAVERFQKRESDPPWFSARSTGTHSPEAIFEQMHAPRMYGKREPSELQNALHNTFAKEGKLSELLSKTDSRPLVRSESEGFSSVRFQNQGAFRGNFEEQGRVFRFESVSSSLAEKIKEEKKFQETTSRWEILDFRTPRSETRFRMNETSSKDVSTVRKESFAADATETETDEKNEFNFSNINRSVSADEVGSIRRSALDETELKSRTEKKFHESEIEPEVESEDVSQEEEADAGLVEREEIFSETKAIVPELVSEMSDSFAEIKEPRLEPILPFPPVTLVPEVRSKRSIYHVPLKSLKTTATKIQDPLFKIESDKVARKIEEIIRQYGYESQVVSMERGPIITRYELTPPPGVKLGRITSLADELRLYLAVKNIRIVAPIPGKSTIGIEVPNSLREDVFLGDILHQNLSLRPKKDLSILIGKDISGKLVSIDLNKLPHLLVAGTTGSGKSVCLNSMISSLVVHLSPEEVRFIMIDPKMVELTLYEDIPHLLMPVITDPKKATRALAWAIQEMEARYHSVSKLKCRDFKTYNEKVEQGAHREGYKKMPYIVIFIDELADLMMVSGKDLEDAITRITQKSRAVGIHLIMATQRPSVDVITGLIKANCPARMAFHVAQKTDSKIILDQNGAESLLGKGDFLYKSPTAADLVRIQSPYVSEEEIERIVEEARKFGKPSYVDFDLDEEPENTAVDEEDEELFEQAWEIVRTDRKASASYLQRRMRIGYNKAARLMELMEERGYVSPQIGSKGREILRAG